MNGAAGGGERLAVVIPKWGLTMQDVVVGDWLVAEGSPVEAEQVLVEVETDKATGEVVAPAAGVLDEIVHRTGETVDVGAVVAYIAPVA